MEIILLSKPHEKSHLRVINICNIFGGAHDDFFLLIPSNEKRLPKEKNGPPHSAKLTIHHIFLCIVIDGDRRGSSNRYHELLMAEKRNVKMRCHQRSKNEDCERAISEVAQEMQTGTRTGEQLTE